MGASASDLDLFCDDDFAFWPIKIRPKCRRFSGENKRRPPLATSSNNPRVSLSTSIETGESSRSFCEICAETKGSDDMFKIEKCSHSFCTDCISKHVVCKIQDNMVTVPCPGLDCKSVLELDSCRSMIPNEVLARWNELLCESLILAAQKFYCPFKDCSALLANDTESLILADTGVNSNSAMHVGENGVILMAVARDNDCQWGESHVYDDVE